jgi:hypothetical protein
LKGPDGREGGEKRGIEGGDAWRVWKGGKERPPALPERENAPEFVESGTDIHGDVVQRDLVDRAQLRPPLLAQKPQPRRCQPRPLHAPPRRRQAHPAAAGAAGSAADGAGGGGDGGDGRRRGLDMEDVGGEQVAGVVRLRLVSEPHRRLELPDTSVVWIGCVAVAAIEIIDDM